MSSQAAVCPAILKMSLFKQWRGKNVTRSWVSSPPRSNKRTEMITSQNPLKSCRVPLNGTKGENYPLSIVRSREFHNSQEILNAKAISQSQPRKKRRAYIIESDDDGWTLNCWILKWLSFELNWMKFVSELREFPWMKRVFPLLRSTEFLTHNMTCKFLRCKSVSGSAFLQTGYWINKMLVLTKILHLWGD